MVEEAAIVDYATEYGVALLQVTSAMDERNKGWKAPEIVETF